MRLEIELVAVFGERRVVLGRLPLQVDLGLGAVTLSDGGPPLTRREREVLDLMILGKVHKEIADALHVSVRTVKFHAAVLYAKYAVHGRDELLRRIAQTSAGK